MLHIFNQFNQKNILKVFKTSNMLYDFEKGALLILNWLTPGEI